MTKIFKIVVTLIYAAFIQIMRWVIKNQIESEILLQEMVQKDYIKIIFLEEEFSEKLEI